MKISSEYVKSFNKLRRAFSKLKDKDFEALPENATEVLILSILATNDTFHRARQAIKILQEKMVDYNELRVTPTVELTELLEEHICDAPRASVEIVKTLNSVFTRFDTFDLSELKDKTKGELSKMFEEIPGCPDHARCAMLLFCFDVPSMPIDDRMREYLVVSKALPAEVDLPEAKAFIERQVKASEIGAFYWQLRKASEAEHKTRKPGKKKKG
ncbi:MAG: hypothetical protein WC975_05915 [Phycisphaerae bacterium]